MQQTIFNLLTPRKATAVYSPSFVAPEARDHLLSTLLHEEEDVTEGIGKPRRAILKALAEYHYLTADQLTRLLYSPTSYTYVNKHLQFLVKNNYVEWLLPAKQLLYDRAPYVYTLSRDGWLYANSQGFSVRPRFRSVTETIHKPFALSHILAVNEFLIKTVLFAKCNPDIVLRRTLHDKVLAGHPMQVHLPELPAEKTKKLIPDSWVDLGQLSIRRRYCYCVEQNLTHVRQKVWRETVRKYLYCTPSYKEQFGTNVLTVLVSIQSATDFPVKPLDRLTPAEQEERAVEAKNREHRRQLLLSWTEAEVKAQNRQRSSDMFRFTSAPLDEMTPEELYCAAHWYTPFQDTPAPLILAAKEESA